MLGNALDYITVQGFKSIASIERLPLKPINIVIGPNGSGKSNFIEAFAFLHAICEGRLRRYVMEAGGAEKLLHFGSKLTKEIDLTLFFRDEHRYELTLAPNSQDGLFPLEEVIYPREENVALGVGLLPRNKGSEAGISAEGDGYHRRVQDALRDWLVFHLNDTSYSSPLRKTAKVDDNRFLRSDGSNVAAFLYYLRESHRTSYDLILRTVQRVAPFFDSFQLEPLRLNQDDIKLEWRHKGSDQYFDASSLSDGTLRFVVLATLFLQPEEFRPSVILVDEPELGLHPFAIEMLAALIRQASTVTQVIVSTQSSLLLDHFEPEDVVVADRVGGGTTLRRLYAPPLAKWLEDYSLGQLWEKNEIGGRPVPG